MKNKKILILTIILLLILIPSLVTFSKYVLEKIGIFSLNLKGVKFDGSNLIISDKVDYNDTTISLINPERGFFVPYEYTPSATYTSAAKEEMLNGASTVKDDLKNNGYTLSRTIIYLSNFKGEDISDDWLSAFDSLCQTFRDDGYKLIIRFAYDKESNADPTNFDQILRHIDQLSSFFTNNSDVIYAIELGFIGPNGEFNNSPYATKEYRNEIIKKALDTVPNTISLLVRKPSYYKDYFGSDYFDHRNGYSNKNSARIGIFNDTFLSNETDSNTYESTEREAELKWMNYLTKYTLSGANSSYIEGETNFFESSNSIYNLTKTHINYLNSNSDSNALNIWENNVITSEIDSTYANQTTFKYITDKLGYRFLVNEVKIPNYAVNQGGYLNFSFSINNLGFSNLIKTRNVYIILEKDGKYYKSTTEIDPRYWFTSETIKEEIVMKIPGNISPGEWNIYIGLPDKSETLQTHENYFIKFANNNIWSNILNANFIGTITIQESNNNSDNGFYQVNTITDMSIENSELLEVSKTITVDGKITNENEWAQYRVHEKHFDPLTGFKRQVNMSDEQRQAAAERLAKAREAK